MQSLAQPTSTRHSLTMLYLLLSAKKEISRLSNGIFGPVALEVAGQRSSISVSLAA